MCRSPARARRPGIGAFSRPTQKRYAFELRKAKCSALFQVINRAAHNLAPDFPLRVAPRANKDGCRSGPRRHRAHHDAWNGAMGQDFRGSGASIADRPGWDLCRHLLRGVASPPGNWKTHGDGRADSPSVAHLHRRGPGTHPDRYRRGLAASAALTPELASSLFGVSPVDPVTYISASILLMGCIGRHLHPGVRAMGVDPMEALRSE